MSKLAIVFDVDNTLYDQLLPFVSALRKFVPSFDGDILELHKRSRFYSDKVLEKVLDGELSSKEGNIYRTKMALSDFGIKITDEVASCFEDFYKDEQKKMFLRSEMKDALDWCLENGLTMGVITNGVSSHQWNKIKVLELEEWIPRENIIVSGDIGLVKPDAEVFKALEEKIPQRAENIYYIGDSYHNDIVGAAGVGWGSIWLDVYGVGAEEGNIRPNFIIRPGDSVVEVLEKLI